MGTHNENEAGDKDYGIYIRPGSDSFVGSQGGGYRVKSAWGRAFLTEMGNSPSFEDVTTRIQRYLKNQTGGTPDIDEAFSQAELDDLQYFKQMAGIEETGHAEDGNQGRSIHDGPEMIYSKYLRKNVLPNRLDDFDVPNYVFTLYMLKSDKYNEFIKKGYSDPETETPDQAREEKKSSQVSVNRALNKPGPQDMVIIAQTGTTDIGIDDVEIQTVNGPQNDITPTLITFQLNEPGSVTLLDRLAEAKNFCGYKNESAILPGMFLELKFRGYTDDSPIGMSGGDRDSGGEMVSVPFTSVDSTMYPYDCVYYELAGITYDMQITPQGATYNFQAYRQKSGGIEDLRLDATTTITGTNISELLGGEREDSVTPNNEEKTEGDAQSDKEIEKNITYGLEEAFRLSFESLDKEVNTDEKGPGNNLRREFSLDISGFINNATGNVNTTTDTISDSLLTDYELLETFAKSGTINRTNEKGKTELDWTDEEDDPLTGADESGNTRRLDSKSIQVGGARADVTITESINGDEVYTDPFIEIRIPAGTHLKDCIYLILSLSDDFVHRALGYKMTDLHKKDLTLDKGYSRWLSLDTDHYYDYDDYEEDTNTYKEFISVKPTLSYNTNPNMIMSKEENKRKDAETELKELKTRLDSLNINKEYYYSFTGRNDQVIDVNFDFNEAFVLTIPAVGFGDYAMQSAMSTATYLKEDEAGKNTQDNTGIADDLKQRQNATGILDTLKELSDSELENFADYVGFSDEEKKRLINEKNANGTGVRGSEGWRYEDQLMLKNLSASLSVDGVGDAILSGYTSTASTTNPTESDTTIVDLEDNIEAKSMYIYASALVMGLEGTDQSAWAQSNIEATKEFVTNMQPGIKTVESPNIVEEAPTERGSIRQTAMSHLMRASTNAASHLMLEMKIRGDTDWLGNDIFYGVPKDSDGRFDFIKRTHDVLFVMEAPRRLDNHETDEDLNTGLFDYGNINFTMSGVYFISHCSSTFSNGLFEQTLNMIYQSKYDMSKLDTLRKDEKKYADFYNEDGTTIQQSEIQDRIDEMLKPKPAAKTPVDEGPQGGIFGIPASIILGAGNDFDPGEII